MSTSPIDPRPDPLREAAEVMRRVRSECVWSQQMTHRDLVPYLIEEAYELIDAVETGSADDRREELGDLLWQVLFHAAVAAESEGAAFDIDDVARTITEKMMRRHPHVFGGETARTPEEVLVYWNAAKAAEKTARSSVVDGVPRSMPALARAHKLLPRAHRVGVQPEAPAATASEPTRVPTSEEEFGEALLQLVAQARAAGVDAERALRERLRMLEAEVRRAEADPSLMER
ncbi:MazG family protein [Microbacterium sp. YY-01]|uniref:MazG family protein n=1 Tax=Microbacterium sp. YY-01 TaxID=3421634 RepID=UPI003D17B576